MRHDRHPVRTVAAAAAAVALAGCGAPPSTAPPPAVEAPPVVAQGWWSAWNGADPARLGALFTDDASYRDLAVGKTSRGRDGITEWKRRTDAGIDQVHVTAEDAFRDGDRVAIQSTYSGHVRGAPTPFAVHMVTILRLRGDLVVDDTDYYSVADLLKQSGLPPTFARP